jgi:hypothetical protein
MNPQSWMWELQCADIILRAASGLGACRTEFLALD